MLKNQRNTLPAHPGQPQPLQWADCHIPHVDTVHPGTRSQSERTPLPSKGKPLGNLGNSANPANPAGHGSANFAGSAPEPANTTPAPLSGSGQSCVQFQGANTSSHSTSPFYFSRVSPIAQQKGDSAQAGWGVGGVVAALVGVWGEPAAGHVGVLAELGVLVARIVLHPSDEDLSLGAPVLIVAGEVVVIPVAFGGVVGKAVAKGEGAEGFGDRAGGAGAGALGAEPVLVVELRRRGGHGEAGWGSVYAGPERNRALRGLTPAHRDNTAMNGPQPLLVQRTSLRLLTGPPA